MQFNIFLLDLMKQPQYGGSKSLSDLKCDLSSFQQSGDIKIRPVYVTFYNPGEQSKTVSGNVPHKMSQNQCHNMPPKMDGFMQEHVSND